MLKINFYVFPSETHESNELAPLTGKWLFTGISVKPGNDNTETGICVSLKLSQTNGLSFLGLCTVKAKHKRY